MQTVQGGHAFRADIQALRAVAVTSAVLFHAKIPYLSGGFYGVDVFFVISGFLITGLLVRELEAINKIDVLAFWARRAWRLLPNALAALTACIIGMVVFGSVTEQRTSAIDVLAALFYVANYRFASRTVDYFDDAAGNSPVLHFWSLSIEEQFYIFWPLLLLAIWLYLRPTRTNVLRAAIAIMLISGGIALYWASRSLPNAFFRTEARIWQLAFGAVLAVTLRDGIASRRKGALCIVGCIGLVVSVTDLHRYLAAVVSPVVVSVVPVVATGLLIAARADTLAAARPIIASSFVQWLGARSYSIYLWHWPVLLFGGAIAGHRPLLIVVALLAAVLIISEIAYRLIETPLRHGSGNATSQSGYLKRLGAAVALVGVAAGGLVSGTTLFQSQERASLIKRIAEARADVPTLVRPDCAANWQSDPQSQCVFGKRDATRPRVVLLGDSYAEHLLPGLETASRDASWSLLPLTRAACPPVVGAVISEQTGVVDTECRQWVSASLDRIERDMPDLVIISSWEGAAARMADPASLKRYDAKRSTEAWQQGFSQVLERLRRAGIATAVIPSTPRGRFIELGTCLSSAQTRQCGLARQQATIRSVLSEKVARSMKGTTLFSLDDQFCGPNVCHSVRDGMIIYRDNNHHLTSTFSRALAPEFRRLLQIVKAQK